MASTSLSDRLIFAVVQCLAVLRHPRITQSFWKRRRRFPNYARPTDHGDMVQWRKVFDHNPQFTVFCDKLACKRWVAANFPDVKVLEPVWVGTRPEELPDAFVADGYVVKTSHGCRSNYFPHRQSLDRLQLNRLLGRWLRRSYYRQGQWGYRHVPRRLLVEPLVSAAAPLREFSIRAHDGVISGVYVVVDQHRPTEQGNDFTAEGVRLPSKDTRPSLPADYAPDETFFRASDIARRISGGFDHIRVDFLIDGQNLYLGEITVYPGSGFGGEWLSAKGKMHELAWFRAMHLSWFCRTEQPWPLSIYQGAFRRFVEAHRRELDAVAAVGQQTGVVAKPVHGDAS